MTRRMESVQHRMSIGSRRSSNSYGCRRQAKRRGVSRRQTGRERLEARPSVTWTCTPSRSCPRAAQQTADRRSSVELPNCLVQKPIDGRPRINAVCRACGTTTTIRDAMVVLALPNAADRERSFKIHSMSSDLVRGSAGMDAE